MVVGQSSVYSLFIILALYSTLLYFSYIVEQPAAGGVPTVHCDSSCTEHNQIAGLRQFPPSNFQGQPRMSIMIES